MDLQHAKCRRALPDLSGTNYEALTNLLDLSGHFRETCCCRKRASGRDASREQGKQKQWPCNPEYETSSLSQTFTSVGVGGSVGGASCTVWVCRPSSSEGCTAKAKPTR